MRGASRWTQLPPTSPVLESRTSKSQPHCLCNFQKFESIEIEVVLELHPHRDLVSVLSCWNKVNLAGRGDCSLSKSVRKNRNAADVCHLPGRSKNHLKN